MSDIAQPFAVTARETTSHVLTDAVTAYLTVTVTAPVAGHVTVNSTAMVSHGVAPGWVRCVIAESTDLPFHTSAFNESTQYFRAAVNSDQGSLSGTRMFTIAAGATIDYVLACEEISNGGQVLGRNLTAIFTPAP